MSNCYSIGQNRQTGYPDGQSQQCIFPFEALYEHKTVWFIYKCNMYMHYRSKAFFRDALNCKDALNCLKVTVEQTVTLLTLYVQDACLI